MILKIDIQIAIHTVITFICRTIFFSRASLFGQTAVGTGIGISIHTRHKAASFTRQVCSAIISVTAIGTGSPAAPAAAGPGISHFTNAHLVAIVVVDTSARLSSAVASIRTGYTVIISMIRLGIPIRFSKYADILRANGMYIANAVCIAVIRAFRGANDGRIITQCSATAEVNIWIIKESVIITAHGVFTYCPAFPKLAVAIAGIHSAHTMSIRV
jgi:hypothetical protein